MKNIFKILLVALVFASCEDVEPVVYNGETSDNTFLSFSLGTYDLPVLRNGNGNLEIVLNSSNISSVDRTYGIELVQIGSNADPATYTLPSSITIPAGSYQGVAEITGEDVGVEIEPKSFIFRITGLTNENIDDTDINVNIFEVCDLGADFTGEYIFTQITDPVMNGNTPIFLFEPNSVVNLEVGDNPYQRKFKASVWPGFFDELIEMRLTLQCDQVSVGRVALGYGCGEGTNFVVGRATTRGSYIEGNDSVITVRVTEDASGSCLSSGREVTFRLTKVVE